MRNAPAVDAERPALLPLRAACSRWSRNKGKPKLLWEYVTGNHVPGPVVVAADGRPAPTAPTACCTACQRGGKQAFAPAMVGEPLGWAAPLVDRAGNTWISAYDGGLIQVDRGRPAAWAAILPLAAELDCAGVLIHRDVLYVGSEDGYVLAIELTGSQGRNRWDHAAGHGCTGWFVNSAPALTADGMLVVAAGDEQLYGFAPGRHACLEDPDARPDAGLAGDRSAGALYVGVCQAQRGRSRRARWSRRRQFAQDPLGVRGRRRRSNPRPSSATTTCSTSATTPGVIHAVDFQGRAQWTARRRGRGPLGRHDSRAAAPGLRPGRRHAGRAALFVRRPGHGRLAQDRPHAGPAGMAT